MLAAARGLHRAGYDVTAASFTGLAATQWSRAASRRIRLVDASEDAERFVEQLRDELELHSYAALIPGSDSSLLAISRARGRLENLTALGLPPQADIEHAFDRRSLDPAAEQAGLVPAESIHCADLEQGRAAARQLGYPVVVKSAALASASEQTVTGAPKGQIVSTQAGLEEASRPFAEGFLVQRWVRGDLVSFGGVLAGGRLLGVALARYRRTWPPDSGSVTFGETIASLPSLERMVQQLIVTIGWEGIFELELIRSGPESFTPIDLNPRPYGSMALATCAGAPLAAIWCDWLLGRREPSQTARARPGVRYRWEDGDLRHLLWQLQKGHYRDALRPLRPRRRVVHAHFQLRDPLPLLARGLCLGKRVHPVPPTPPAASEPSSRSAPAGSSVE